MNRLFISLAGMTMLVGTSFAVTSDGTNLTGGNDTENNYKTIQLETDGGEKAHAVISKEESEKLKNLGVGEKVKLHIKDDVGQQQNGMGQGTTDPNVVQQPQ